PLHDALPISFTLGGPRHTAYTERSHDGGHLCMKVFLTGGSGYIGSTVALALKKAGHDVLALVRSEAKGETLKKAGVKLAVGDLGNPAGYAGSAWGRAAFVNVAQEYSPQGVELDR